jgi:flagellar basal body P-ring formation protein FlgA
MLSEISSCKRKTAMKGRTGGYAVAVAVGLLTVAPALSPPVKAAQIQDPGTIRAAIETAMSSRMTANDANVEVSVGAIDSRLQLPACPSVDVTLPPTNTASMTAKVSCDLPRWTIYVPVRVRAWVEAVVAAANLVPNRALSLRDLTRGKVDLFAAPGGVLTDPKQVEGKILRNGLVVGSPILATMLDLPISVRRGQRVVLTASDQTMIVKTSAVALEDGRVGDNIPVQNPDSQKTVNATVTRDGGVEIKF